VTDDDGRVMRYEYDASGRLALLSDGARRTHYNYDGTLLSSIVRDDTGKLVDIAYQKKRVTEIAFANGTRFRFSPGLEGGGAVITDVEAVDEHGIATPVALSPRH